MKEKTCCFTGHRNLSDIDYEVLRSRTISAIQSLIDKGADTFICGGAIGFDMLSGLIITQLKEENKALKLILFLPHKNQDEFYDGKNKRLYEYIKNNADQIVYTSPDYYDGCLQFRNRCMVENSSYLVSYCTKNYGGSYYTSEYAKELNLDIININADDL